MDKINEKSNEVDFLKFRTDISAYNLIFIGVFAFVLFCFLVSIKFGIELIEILIYIILLILFGNSVFFTERVVSIFHLPHDILLVYRDRLIHKTKKTQTIYKIDEIKIVFIPFIKDLVGASRIVIRTNNKDIQTIGLTSKQYKKMMNFINSGG